MLKKFNAPFPINPDLAFLILRIGLSLLMLRFGYAKFEQLMEGNFDFPDPLGLGSRASLVMTVFAEFFCSMLLMIGLFTRPALVFLMITMLVVIFLIHKNDPFDDKEHAISFLIPYTALWLTGPGKYSLDHRFFKH